MLKMQELLSMQDWNFILSCDSADVSFSSFYGFLAEALDLIFPLKTVRPTIKARDPTYMTPHLKYLLRQKNRKHRRHQHTEHLAARINQIIARHNSRTFDGLAKGSRHLWTEVRRLRGAKIDCQIHQGPITADSLNQHYSEVSTDNEYVLPEAKSTVAPVNLCEIYDYHVFYALAAVRGTSVGPDGVPSWLLSSMAHFLSTPIASLFQKSLTDSFIPPQWKESKITPIPKIACPVSESDFRPISITPTLCKILEKLLVQSYYYPVFTNPMKNSMFTDQFAFRPTGSTSAALIALTHHLLETLEHEPFARLISLDFSKAFDTARHNSLAVKLASLPIPDFVYNWVIALLPELLV